jgi:hypothetical protein
MFSRGVAGPAHGFKHHCIHHSSHSYAYRGAEEERKTAGIILKAREQYNGSVLSDMYDPDREWMFPELIKVTEPKRLLKNYS